MYCGQCGKKVMENMLFCPFCGSPIVIPEQDSLAAPIPEQMPAAEAEPAMPEETAAEEALAEETQGEENLPVDEAPAQAEADRPVSLFAEEAPRHQMERGKEEKEFIPLSFDFDEQLAEHDSSHEMVSDTPAEEEQDQMPDIHPDVLDELFDVPPRRPAPRPRRPENASRRPANTYIPIKEINPDDMFMDGFDDDADDYDLDDAPARSRYREAEFDFEEPERGSFFQRHIRGIVGLILLLIMLVICAAWAFSPKGQDALARVNLAWKSEAYADLGYAAYHQDSDLLAARYYEKALSRDADNYEYAHSAMVAYYEANEIESAAAMLKKCVEMAPENPEPYQEMLILYPDAETRPWEISELIRLGYQRTGHEALNIQ